MTRTLIVTNDFPPRPGGIQAFVHALAARRPADSVVIYCSSPAVPAKGDRTAGRWRTAEAFDLAQPFPIIRERTSTLLPTPQVRRRAQRIARLADCDSVLFGAAAPLGLLAPGLRASGVERIVGLTHGHEAGWALLPGARELLRRIGDSVDTLTYLGEYTRRKLARALSAPARARMRQLAPGVDEKRYFPGAGGAEIRARHGLGERPVVVCVSRLVPRKGQDTLLRAWPAVQARVPEAALLLVGDGPYRPRLERMARELNLTDSVRFTGPVPWEELPAHYDAGDVFAMPCRTRNAGLDVEGLGIVYLEAAATGLPVLAGDSGGAPEAVASGETGYVVDGRSVPATARHLVHLLTRPEWARAMGARGRAWVEEQWRWDRVAERFDDILTSG